jgi:hypothetical protein
MATQDEIEKLKKNWIADPCWDLENEDGFGEHREELLKFRLETESAWQLEEEDRIARRARVVEIDTDITKAGAAQSIRTYEEIETGVRNIENETDDQVACMMAYQVRATLLLAAQTQRVANGIWELIESMDASDNSDFMTRLYNISK